MDARRGPGAASGDSEVGETCAGILRAAVAIDPAGHPFVERFVNRRKDGSEFLVWESVSPVKASDGSTQYFMAILTDLSEREQMLEALRHTEQVKLVGQLAGDFA